MGRGEGAGKDIFCESWCKIHELHAVFHTGDIGALSFELFKLMKSMMKKQCRICCVILLLFSHLVNLFHRSFLKFFQLSLLNNKATHQMLYLHGKLFWLDTLFYNLFFSCDCSILSKMYSNKIFFVKCFRNVNISFATEPKFARWVRNLQWKCFPFLWITPWDQKFAIL